MKRVRTARLRRDSAWAQLLIEYLDKPYITINDVLKHGDQAISDCGRYLPPGEATKLSRAKTRLKREVA